MRPMLRHRVGVHVTLPLLVITGWVIYWSQGQWRSPASPASSLLARMAGPITYEDPQLLRLVQGSFLEPPAPGPYNLSTDPTYHNLTTNGGYIFIYKQVKKLFGDQRGGFFVEAGALDGEWLSNTLWLEQELGWTGLLVEPSPSNYQNLFYKRRKAWLSQCCLSPEPYPLQTVFLSHSRMFIKGNEEDAKLNLHNTKGSSHMQGVRLDSPTYNKILEKVDTSYSIVQCLPLATLLLALNRTRIDFLSLDIQGVEKQVLANFPWELFEVRVIVVEIVHNLTHDHQFVAEMKKRNYTLVFFYGEDYVFVRDSDPLLEKYEVAEVHYGKKDFEQLNTTALSN